MDLRPVGAEHRRHLEAFSCGTPGEPFSKEVEQQIRETLSAELEAGSVSVLGSWDGDNLAALVAYTTGGQMWRVTLLASQLDYRGWRQGRRLKLEVLHLAAEAGVRGVASVVHRDNFAMQKINFALGGVFDPPTDPTSPYEIWTLIARPRGA